MLKGRERLSNRSLRINVKDKDPRILGLGSDDTLGTASQDLAIAQPTASSKSTGSSPGERIRPFMHQSHELCLQNVFEGLLHYPSPHRSKHREWT